MTDEHCLIYCRQTADHRKQGRKPICRTVCLRRVFKSEMESSFSSSEQDVPLPPEGQPQYTLLDAEPLPASTSYSPSTASDRNPTLLTKSPQGAESQRQQERPRIWQPGYYLWTSASSRAAQERIETMAMDIGREHDWIRKREEWIKQQQKVLGEMGVFIRNNEISLPANISGKWIGLDGNGNGDDGAENRRILLGDGIALTSSGQIEGPWYFTRFTQTDRRPIYPAGLTPASGSSPSLASCKVSSSPLKPSCLQHPVPSAMFHGLSRAARSPTLQHAHGKKHGVPNRPISLEGLAGVR